MQDQLDPQVVNLSKAIRQTESGGDFNAKGKSGEHGAYQFMPDTWNEYSREAGVNVPLEQATPQQQNEVAYKKIKQWKDQGLNVGQIASSWNAGPGKPNAYLEGNSGTNNKGVKYDTATYAKSVAEQYQQYKQQSGGQQNTYNPTPFSKPADGASKFVIDTSGQSSDQNQSKGDTLGSELGQRGNDITKSISDYQSGKQGLASTALQGIGSLAGGLGDIINKGIELIPGVKAIEGVIGSGIGKLAETAPGQAIVKSLKDFGEAHPELSKDAGAAFNIVTAIPILKGLGVAKNLALDGASTALKNVAEKAAAKDLTATAARTIGGRKALESTPNAISTLIKERAIPDIAENKYVTKEAFDKLNASISNIENKELQPALKSVSTSGVDTRQPIENIRQQALADIRQEFKTGGNVGKAESEVNRIFDDYRGSYGDYVTLEDVNDMKRGIRGTVNFNSPKLEGDVSYHLGQIFQKNIEEAAAKLGLADIGAINARMGELIKAQDMLKHIEGKPVKVGVVGNFLKDAATAGGEALGNSAGIPIAGAYLGRESTGFAPKKFSGIYKGILNRTGKGATKETVGNIKSKTKGLLTGAFAQKAIKQK